MGAGFGELAILIAGYMLFRFWRLIISQRGKEQKDRTGALIAALLAVGYGILGMWVMLDRLLYASHADRGFTPFTLKVFSFVEFCCWIAMVVAAFFTLMKWGGLGPFHQEMYMIAVTTAFGCAATMHALIHESRSWVYAVHFCEKYLIPILFIEGLARFMLGMILVRKDGTPRFAHR